MDELLFTQADRPRGRPITILMALLPLAVFCVPLCLSGHWVTGGALVAVGGLLGFGLRSLNRGAWLKVDAMGISFARMGGGQTTQIAWHEIENVQIVEARTQGGTIRNVKALRRVGKPVTLPVLSDSPAFPDPGLPQKVEAIRALASHFAASHQAAVPVDHPYPDGVAPVPPAQAVPLVVESSWSRRDAKFRRWQWRYLAPFAACGMLAIGAFSLGPAWSAHLSGGKQGTFTATAQHCGRECDWIGDFVSADGTDSRSGVVLASGGSVHRVGDRTPARDTGDTADVYPADGGHDWIYFTLLTLFAAGVLVAWVRSVLVPALRARASGSRVSSP